MLAATPARAVPTLQLYLPGAEYFETLEIAGVTVTESWFTTDNPFELVVAGATSPNWVDHVEDVTLFIAVQKDDFEDNPGGTVTLRDAADQVIAPTGPAIFGNPGLPPHGIFDAYFFEFLVAGSGSGGRGRDRLRLQ